MAASLASPACGVKPLVLSVVAALLAINCNDVPCTDAFQMPHRLAARPPPHRAASRCRGGLRMSDAHTNPLPSEEEIMQQKREAYEALSSFHETSSAAQSSSEQMKSLMEGLDTIGSDEPERPKPECWACREGAIAYGVPMDPAAGLKRGTISPPYKSFVQVDMELGDLARGGPKRRGLRLVESIQFEESMPFARSIPLGANVDVDAVDGSYSLDDTVEMADAPSLPLLPQSLMAGIDPKAVQFLVEHTLAISETERSRCFLLYGDESGKGTNSREEYDEEEDAPEDEDFAVMAAKKTKSNSKDNAGSVDESERNYRLLGVIIAEETKVMPEEEEQPEEEEDYAAEFISQMIESPSPSKSPSSPLDLLAVDQSDSEDDKKMQRLMDAMNNHNQRVLDSATGGSATKMQRHSLGMFGITSGVWLGDAFIRESIPSTAQLSGARQSQKGFGKTSSGANSGNEEDRFATWNIGVQKVALQFDWDYHESVAQAYTYGKVMGVATSLSSMANLKSEGIVVVNEARRTKKREERRVIWDMDGGSYVAGLIGSSYFRAPRYMSFSRSRSYSADAYLTEFIVFMEDESSSNGGSESEPLGIEIGENAASDYYCSKSSRLYNAKDGRLMQGSTAFFAMKQPTLEATEE